MNKLFINFLALFIIITTIILFSLNNLLKKIKNNKINKFKNLINQPIFKIILLTLNIIAVYMIISFKLLKKNSLFIIFLLLIIYGTLIALIWITTDYNKDINYILNIVFLLSLSIYLSIISYLIYKYNKNLSNIKKNLLFLLPILIFIITILLIIFNIPFIKEKFITINNWLDKIYIITQNFTTNLISLL